MKDISWMTRNRVREEWNTKMVPHMKENGKKIKDMAKANTFSWMAIHLKGNGQMMRSARELKLKQMVIDMKEHFWRNYTKAKVF